MASPFLEEETDETAPDYLGIDVPVAFRGQPALPTQGAAPVASPSSPVSPGGEGGPIAIPPAGAPDAPDIAPSGNFPNIGTLVATFGPKFADVAGRLFGGEGATGSFGGTPTGTGGTTTSAPDITRDRLFPDVPTDAPFDPTLVGEPPLGAPEPTIPGGFDDALGWATLVASIVAPAIQLSGILDGGGDLVGNQAGARGLASQGLQNLGTAYADAAVTGDPMAVFAALANRQAGGSIRSELALPNDVIAELGLPPSQAGRYDWAALSPDQARVVAQRFQQDPTLVDQWIIGSGDVARLPESDALGVADAAAQMARATVRHTLGLPAPTAPDPGIVSDFENIAQFLAESGGETGGPDGAPPGASFAEGGRAFGPTSPLSSNVAKAIQLGMQFAPVPFLSAPLSASRGVEFGLNQIVANFPNLAAALGITGVDVGPVGPDLGAMFSNTPTTGNTIGFANPTGGYVFGRAGVGAATGNAPPGSTNFGSGEGNTSGASPSGGTGIGEGQDAP